MGNATGAGAEELAATASEEVGNAACSGSSSAGKETGRGKSLVGIVGASLSAWVLAVGLIDGARTEAVGARTEGARREAATTCGDSEANASAGASSI